MSDQNPAQVYMAETFFSPTGELPYRIYEPSSIPADDHYPLLLFLHGLGECGDDNEATLVHGAADFVDEERQTHEPCCVVIPQCPLGEYWADISYPHRLTRLAEQPSRPLQLVLELLDWVTCHYSIDPTRIYLTGLSMGGYGVWDLLMRSPERFAAAIPICGGADLRLSCVDRLQKIPLWVFHGSADDVVPPQRSREIVAALQRIGNIARYTEYKDGDHDSWTATYANPEVWQWLFQQRRTVLA